MASTLRDLLCHASYLTRYSIKTFDEDDQSYLVPEQLTTYYVHGDPFLPYPE